MIFGIRSVSSNKKAFEAYEQEQRSVKQLDTPKADLFYAEQPKTDKVKEPH